jgi:predicted CoA-binding protein
MNEPATIRAILENTKTIAVVGLSDDPERPSYGVARYMQQHGYRIIPVNPQIASALGETAYGSLDDACHALKGRGITIDLVNVFRAPAFVPEVVKDVMRLKIPALWLQEGVCHEEAAEWAEADGIKVVMDRCILKDHAASA